MASYYYGDICLPEVPTVDGFPYFIIVQDERFDGWKYRAMLTSQGFKQASATSIQMQNQTERQNYVIADGGVQWIEAVSVGISNYSFVNPSECPIIFTNSDIYNGSTLVYPAQTPVAASHSILTYLYNATAATDNPTEIGGTATLKFTAADGGSLPDAVVVKGAEYAWDSATGTLTLSEATETVRVWVGYAEKYEIDFRILVDLADAIRDKTGDEAALTPEQMVAALRTGE